MRAQERSCISQLSSDRLSSAWRYKCRTSSSNRRFILAPFLQDHTSAYARTRAILYFATQFRSSELCLAIQVSHQQLLQTFLILALFLQLANLASRISQCTWAPFSAKPKDFAVAHSPQI
eukprot:TRINITY_DN8965_c0_g1_i1.p1 TRINITY_DN8965_c0_g1~~TRINITY_DN8965_c0_g1_i1.p1  ORF type:complete len:120 (+),score=5.21 TRINITY_DN8965_c0_g1_i1:73-432(+)